MCMYLSTQIRVNWTKSVETPSIYRVGFFCVKRLYDLSVLNYVRWLWAFDFGIFCGALEEQSESTNKVPTHKAYANRVPGSYIVGASCVSQFNGMKIVWKTSFTFDECRFLHRMNMMHTLFEWLLLNEKDIPFMEWKFQENGMILKYIRECVRFIIENFILFISTSSFYKKSVMEMMQNASCLTMLWFHGRANS